MIKNMNYGIILKELRLDNNLTQKDVANILNIARQTYNHYEVQESIIPVKYLNVLANYYQVSIDYILGLTSTLVPSNNLEQIDFILSGNRLKEWRKDEKLTQTKLAEVLNTFHTVVVDYEKGRNLIATPFLYTICKKYHVSADYLLGRIDEPKYIKKED